MSARWAGRLVVGLSGAAILLVLTTPSASAHNVLVGSSPADRASVARTPSEVVLTFNEPAVAMGTQLVVVGPRGPVGQGTPRLVDRTVTQGLAGGAPAGDYTVEWRVTSADGHPVSGVLHFTARAAGAGESSVAPSRSPEPTATSSTPGRRWWWVAVVLVAAALTSAVWRRRRRSPARLQPRSEGE